MKNIETILSDFGITIPEGKAADLRRCLNLNMRRMQKKLDSRG